ncbi:MAG: ribosome recycling factor [Ignavibacteriales bacterium]|nr:ribosome recycling factor [Ignavibacteriales bacterium]
MQVKEILKNCETRMQKAIESVRHELVKIRTGKATTALLDTVKVDAYGTLMPINQVGSVSVLDAHMLTVTPWDQSMVKPIEQSIIAANLGLNPSIDGKLVRVPIPPLNEERRKELVKLVKKFGEEGKIAIRNVRRDENEQLKKSEKDEHFSEDERKRGEAEVQKYTDKFIKEVDMLLAQKEKEIMEV